MVQDIDARHAVQNVVMSVGHDDAPACRVVQAKPRKGSSPLLRMKWLLSAMLLGLLPGCDMRMPDMGAMLPSFSSGASLGAAPVPAVAVPRGADALADFVATAQPGSVGTVNGERARLNRAYNAASGRECREVILGFGNSERSAVACRDASGNFVSSQPLLRGSLR
jgi:17 kDa common-antigen outer membrane protein